MNNEFFDTKINRKFDKRITDNDFIDKLDLHQSNCEKVWSLNKSCFNLDLIKNANTIIVGTLTPPNGMENGYYYSSNKNRIFSIIDKCLNTNGKFLSLKKQLLLNPKSKVQISQIENALFEYKLAFIDVINKAVRIKNSPNDNDILFFSLDYFSFEKCAPYQKFICTSQNAENCLLRITENKNVKINKDNIFVCYQDRFHFNINDWQQKLK